MELQKLNYFHFQTGVFILLFCKKKKKTNKTKKINEMAQFCKCIVTVQPKPRFIFKLLALTSKCQSFNCHADNFHLCHLRGNKTTSN